jgi:K+-sensing histidine kinase KdpD
MQTTHTLTSRFWSGGLTPWRAHGFAVVMTGTVLVLRLALDRALTGQPAMVLFTIPVMLSAYVGGWSAGLLATVLSYLGASFFLLRPIHSFLVDSATDRWQQLVFVMSGIVLSALSEALHRAGAARRNRHRRAP